MANKNRLNSRDVLKEMFDHLIKDDKQAAYMLTQMTWRHNNDLARFNSLIPHRLLSYEIIDGILLSLNARDYVIKMKYLNWETKKEHDVTIKARMIRERKPYTPCITGEWGVNPISMLKQVE